MKTSDSFICNGRMDCVNPNFYLFRRKTVRGQVGDGLVRCERDRLVACEIFELLMVCLDELCGCLSNIKRLLDEVEHDIMNYQNRGLCYIPKPKPEGDNTDTRF